MTGLLAPGCPLHHLLQRAALGVSEVGMWAAGAAAADTAVTCTTTFAAEPTCLRLMCLQLFPLRSTALGQQQPWLAMPVATHRAAGALLSRHHQPGQLLSPLRAIGLAPQQALLPPVRPGQEAASSPIPQSCLLRWLGLAIHLQTHGSGGREQATAHLKQ